MHIRVTDTRTLTDETPWVRELEFHNVPVSLGSHSANTLQLTAESVQPYHGMMLPVADDEWVFQATGPSALTLINDKPSDGQVPLADGDEITIAPFAIKFYVDHPGGLELPESRNLDELVKIREYPLPARSQVRSHDANVSLSPTRRELVVSFAAGLSLCPDAAAVMDHTLDLLLGELGARTVWMGVRRTKSGPIEQMAGRAEKGSYVGEPPMLETFLYRCLSRYQFITIPRTGQKDTQSVLAVPILRGLDALGLIHADTQRHRRVFDEADLDFVTALSGFIARRLDEILNERATERAAQLDTELVFLRDLQASLDPQNIPQWPQLQVAAYARPGSAQATDVYDIVRIPNGLASIMMARIKTEPMRASLAMAEIRTAHRIASLHADPPHVQLRAMNWLLQDSHAPCRADVAILMMNPKTGAAEYCTAGDISAWVVDARGNPRPLFDAQRPPLGTTKEFEYAAQKERIRDGGTLAYFSPGCATARNSAGDELGPERMVDALCDGFGLPASAALGELKMDLAGFLKENCPIDDITMLLVHRQPVSAQ